jgi:hypothetical protein
MVRERYDFKSIRSGSWLEVYLPLREGKGRWIIVDPQHLARSGDQTPSLHRDAREYLYSMFIIPALLNYQGLVSSELLVGGDEPLKPIEEGPGNGIVIDELRNTFLEATSHVITSFINSGLTTRREFQYALGSAHLFVSRPVSGELASLATMNDPDYIFNFDATPESVRSLWQVKIGPRDDLILEIGVTDEDFDLENIENRQVINRMEAASRELRNKLLDGKNLSDLLEFSFYRDKYSDRLQKVSLRISRLLIRDQARLVIRMLQKNELVTEAEGNKLLRFFNITARQNMYYVLEQARFVKRTMTEEAEGPEIIE